MKRVLSILLSLSMLVGMLSGVNLFAFAYEFKASEDLTSGKCGENVNYSIDKESGVLTISGEGAMYDYTLPWRDDSPNPSPFCKDENGLEINHSLIKKIVIEDGVTHIGAYSFFDRILLTDVEMANSVQSIGAYAFFGGSLKNVSLSKGLVSIGYAAFKDNINLEHIELPDTLKSIGTMAFSDTTITDINIPDGITEIAPYAFSYTMLKKVVVPDSVVSIGSYAFSHCIELTEVTLGNKVQMISKGAFMEDEMLTKITINNNFIYIDNDAFAYSPVRNISFAGKKEAWYEDVDKKDQNEDDARKGLTKAVIHCSDGDINYQKIYYLKDTYIGNIKDKTYTGNAIGQEIYITYDRFDDFDEYAWLQEGTDYTVSYKNNIKVGTATVIIKGKGVYKGTVTKTFKINPKGTSITKLTAKSKGFTVKWKKQKTQTDGFQIQYASDKKFTKNKKTITVSKNTTTSKSVSKLSAKKKYYVRIRTYKLVGSKKYYSSWSKALKVKTK